MIPRLQIVTVATREDGVYGCLKWDERPFALTLERSGDERRVVIPAGVFLCRSSFYRNGSYSTFEIDIPGAGLVLFRRIPVEDLEPCVIVASSFDEFKGKAVFNGQGGFAELMRLTLGLPEFFLSVVR